MRCLLCFLFFAFFELAALAQTSSTAGQSPPVPTSDPQAVSLAQQSITALTGGTSISDVTMSGNVTTRLGFSADAGTATLEAKGNSESRVDLSIGGTDRSDVRDVANGVPAGAWVKNSGTVKHYAGHNCWTDAAWFFPALSSLSQSGNANFVFKFLGQTKHEGVDTQHVRIFQAHPGDPLLFQQLSTMDFYLNSATLLPTAIVFNEHPDANAGANMPVEIDFSNYQVQHGVAVPMHIKRYEQGTLMMDLTVSSVSFNQGLVSATFSLN